MKTAWCFPRRRMAITPGPPHLFPTSCASPARGTRFAYAPSHSTYINAAAANATPRGARLATASHTRHCPGDLICTGRATAANLALRRPAHRSALSLAHCDIVISTQPGQLTVLGGNVDDAVTEKHVPLTATRHPGRPGRRAAGTRGMTGSWCCASTTRPRLLPTLRRAETGADTKQDSSSFLQKRTKKLLLIMALAVAQRVSI